jgi:ATP-dependent Zn protease
MVGALGMSGSLVSFEASGGGPLDSGLVARVLADDASRHEIEKMLDRAKESVRELLDANRHVVEALRDELLERNELVGDEITGVIAEALAVAALGETE